MSEFKLKSIREEREGKFETRKDPEKYSLVYQQAIRDSRESPSPVIEAALKHTIEADYNHANTIYYIHPLRVGTYISRIASCTDEDVAVALMHNIFEVTGISYEDMADEHSTYIADSCRTLTINRDLQVNDPAYMGEYYGRLNAAPVPVRIVKIYDKLDNLLTLYEQPSKERRNKYFKDILENIVPMAAAIDLGLADYMSSLVDNNIELAEPH